MSWQEWSRRAGPAASGLAALLACLALVKGLLNHRTFAGIPNGAFPGAGVLFVGAVAASATWRSWGVRFPRLVSVVLAGVAVLTVAGSCFVLLNLIQLATTGSFGGDAKSNWVAFTERLGFAALGLLFVMTAASWRRRTSGVCSRCGNAHSSEVVRVERPVASAASRRVCRIAYAGCCAFVPYLSLHGLHFAGLASWFDDLYSKQTLLIPSHPLLSFALFAISLIGPAVFLLLGLVRPWGMTFPRWCLWLAGKPVPRFLPLAPVWLVAPTLALYGTGSVIYALMAGYSLIGLGGAASLAFGGYGWALAVAAVSYQRRTRPICVSRSASALNSAAKSLLIPRGSRTRPAL